MWSVCIEPCACSDQMPQLQRPVQCWLECCYSTSILVWGMSGNCSGLAAGARDWVDSTIPQRIVMIPGLVHPNCGWHYDDS